MVSPGYHSGARIPERFWIFFLLLIFLQVITWSVLGPQMRQKVKTRMNLTFFLGKEVAQDSEGVHHVIFLKYDRRLCTGLGDRLSVFLAVAAMARALNAVCYVYWCEDNPHSHLFYKWSDISMHMRFPSSLVVLTKKDFDRKTKDMISLNYEGGALPAYHAYDGVYTLAFKTMVLPIQDPEGFNRSCTEVEFHAAYRLVSKDWRVVLADLAGLPPEYIAFHVREGDKLLDHKVSGYRTRLELEMDRALNRSAPDGASDYCTREVLEWLEKQEVPVIVISNDDVAKRRILSDFGHSLVIPSNKGHSKISLEMRDLAIMMQSVGLVQHTPSAWSSYSSTVAMARHIPLFSTWHGPYNVLTRFEEAGGKPEELTSCNSSGMQESIAKFWREVESKRVAKRLQLT